MLNRGPFRRGEHPRGPLRRSDKVRPMNPEEFRAFGHRLIDWIADYRAGTASRPVMSTVEPGSIRAKLKATPPTDPESMDAVMRDVEQVLIPGLSHWQHPRFFGYFPSNGELSS